MPWTFASYASDPSRLNMREAKVMATASAAKALSGAFDELPRGEGETFVLVHLSESKTPNGETPDGFQPGYIPTVWPVGYASSDWPFGLLPDGRAYSRVLLSPAEAHDSFSIEILDEQFGTFSARRL